MLDNTLGDRIKLARKARGLTLDAVAREVGVHKSTIQRYEKNEYANPKLPVIESIARALAVNPSWLAGMSSDMNPPGPARYIAATLSDSLSRKLARLDAADHAKVEAYTDGLLSQDKYKSASSAG